MNTDIRTTPDERFIASVRARFPVETEIDRVLTRKLKHRAGPGYSAIPLETLIDGARALIGANVSTDFALSNPRWLQGGASKLQMAFDLVWQGLEGGDTRTTPMVLRMEPPEAIVETSRLREFEALQIAGDVVPVPPCFWVDKDGTYLPHPAIIYGFAEGVSRPTARPSQQVTGIGTNFGPGLREVLADQFIDALAKIHTIEPTRFATLTSFDPVSVGTTESAIRQVNWWRRVWEEDRPEDLPLVDVATRWLLDNAPTLDHVSLVHGDFRAGNFLYLENESRISAWLDWELATLGDRHQDLSWITGRHFGHYAEDNETFLVCGLLPEQEFYRRYEAASGLPVDPVRLQYYRIFNDFMSTVHMLATAYRVAHQGKTHQDVLVAFLSMIGNVIVGKLRDSLEEVL